MKEYNKQKKIKQVEPIDDYDKCPDKEPYYQTGIYAITINPCDDYQIISNIKLDVTTDTRIQTKTSSVKRYNLIQASIEPLLKDYRYQLYWDVSCPTDIRKGKFPRLHLHGIIDLQSSMALEEFLLRTLMVMSEKYSIKMRKIESFDGYQKWLKYCKKYQNVLKREPIMNYEIIIPFV